ncbi:unnamed protein product [Protopolystoma xenopodis]|uniref:Uncharacterized protein n=1 Tax=Protopolystoma xenopodis TaxID=117903 RepID=A0A448WRX0_9PLAT|nr:unnamed protein product [Protopolystoma xenopodis]
MATFDSAAGHATSMRTGQRVRGSRIMLMMLGATSNGGSGAVSASSENGAVECSDVCGFGRDSAEVSHPGTGEVVSSCAIGSANAELAGANNGSLAQSGSSFNLGPSVILPRVQRNVLKCPFCLKYT